MLTALLRKLFGTTVYVQLSPERVSARNVQTGASVTEAPLVALKPGTRNGGLLAHGAAAAAHTGTGGVTVINPFGHPRTLVSDFIAGEMLVRALIREVATSNPLRPAPYVVLHPLGDPDGGYTQIELRALREMAMGAGASMVKVWVGQPLTDQELTSGTLRDADGPTYG